MIKTTQLIGYGHNSKCIPSHLIVVHKNINNKKLDAMITNSWSRRQLSMITAAFLFVSVIMAAIPLVGVIIDVIHYDQGYD